jgi:hypothetical protein
LLFIHAYWCTGSIVSAPLCPSGHTAGASLLLRDTDDGYEAPESGADSETDDDDDGDASADRREPSIAAHLLSQSVQATRPRATAAILASRSTDSFSDADDHDMKHTVSHTPLIAAPMVYFCVVAVEPASLANETTPFRVDIAGGRTAVRTEGSGACHSL